MSTIDKIANLRDRRQTLEQGGGKDKQDKQHASGKKTARERIAMLLDEGSFIEVDAFVEHRGTKFGMENMQAPAEGVVTGYGTVDGRLVFVYAQDFTVIGGSLGEMHAKKICKVMDMAVKMGAPIIGINDSGGARIQEGIDALAGFGEIFFRNHRSFRRNPADFCYHGALRGRCSIFAGDSGFHFHGGQNQSNVYYRSTGHQSCYRRRCDSR